MEMERTHKELANTKSRRLSERPCCPFKPIKRRVGRRLAALANRIPRGRFEKKKPGESRAASGGGSYSQESVRDAGVTSGRR